MFPEKLTVEGFQYRTTRINEALKLMLLFDETSRGKKNGTNQKFPDLSQDVTWIGFEPMTYCLEGILVELSPSW
jgi:site-specific DNA recombinase